MGEKTGIEVTEKSALLVVEGKDDKNFFEKLLKKMDLSAVVQLEVVGGKDKFRDKIPSLIIRGTLPDVELQMIGVIRDADNDPKAAFNSIRDIFRKKTEHRPPDECGIFADGDIKVGIFIMPSSEENGMLEDLCLQSVQGHPVLACVDDFFACVRKQLVEKGEAPLDHMQKRRAQVYLATMPELCKDIGRAAQKGYWDFEAPELSELKSFLEQFHTT